MALSHLVTILGVVALTTANINITSPPITNWGDWGVFQRCPWGRYAQGFQLKTEPNQYLGDDTALNAIRLFCGDPYRPDTGVVTSTIGDFGEWGNVYTCYPGVLTGFQLRVESERSGSGDDTATNNARFFCSSLPNPNDYIEGDGMSWGDWSQAQHCYGGQAICGIQTQVEPYRDSGDDTMLNNVRLECCQYSATELQADYDRVKEMGAYPQAVNPKFAAFIKKAVAWDLTKKSGHGSVDSQKEKVDVPFMIKTAVEAINKKKMEASKQAKMDLPALMKAAIEKIKQQDKSA